MPGCKSLQPVLARLVQEHPEVSIIYKDFPILGEGSAIAARAGLAAVKQGLYAAFHDLMMGSRIPEHQLTEAQILDRAKQAGLDIGRLQRDMADPAVEAKIAETRTLAATLGIQGTPGLLIGTQLVAGQPAL
jgi:protein-disulfide isomerase